MLHPVVLAPFVVAGCLSLSRGKNGVTVLCGWLVWVHPAIERGGRGGHDVVFEIGGLIVHGVGVFRFPV